MTIEHANINSVCVELWPVPESKQCLAASLSDLLGVRVEPPVEIGQAITRCVQDCQGLGGMIQYVRVHMPIIMFLK